MPTENKPPPIVRKRSERSTITVNTSSDTSASMNYTAVVAAAKDKANSVVHSARAWLTPSTEWTSSLTQLESLSTVMFSPLAAHPVYRSESMVKALQLMQQQQQRQQTPNSTNALAAPRDLVLHGKMYAWPSSAVLLQADIPETNNPVSLFQGFASAYPSLAKASRSPKRNRAKKKKQQQQQQPTDAKPHRHSKDLPRSLTQIISEREKRVRDCDKISMQKSSTANEIDQINLQINELLSKRQTLEQKWEKLEEKDIQLQLIIDDLNDAIMDIEEGGSISGRASKSDRGNESDSDDDEDIESGTCFKTLEGHTDDVVCLDFNHPKGMLVSSSMDGTVKAWDLYRNRCLGNLEGHTGVVRCLDLNEARLLTGADDHTIKQWDLSLIPPSFSGSSVFSSTPSSPSLTAIDGGIVNETFTLEGHQGEITALDANQSSVVSGSNDKTIRQWDLETQQCVLTLDVMWASKNGGGIVDSWLDTAMNYGYAAHDFVGALQFWDFALASGTSDGKIRMWDLRTGQAHRTLPGHSAPITCLQFDQVHLVSGSLDKTIRIWDLRTGSVFDTLTYTTPVSSLQFDASKIISSGTSNTIDVYNRTSFQHSALVGHKQHVNSIRFRNDVLASGGSDNSIKLWSI
ncbi:WD40-repeat-containing domain protein [Mucor lusitanicus]|uniref:WD40-repeat-containing domain protein n=2 Tax=Mucor circinelloides f. lusitanicus TaxID=29924 RepID=A0A8H4BAD9_MUCCL|nr:WD40-repeat-containing domain protein [Mucor lusitanicus]